MHSKAKSVRTLGKETVMRIMGVHHGVDRGTCPPTFRSRGDI